ncbi:MAG: VIT1/CCC1 transporter family protein [Algoriphagus aquaeductus]|uniref:VIT1/CCC1 transporter family protein n=1 Tax=Algoriphagus aquaeductus TaxID=475299 RepID=UPI00387A290D
MTGIKEGNKGLQIPEDIKDRIANPAQRGLKAVLFIALLSAIGLFGIGSAITLFTGKSVWYSGFRQVLFGLMAAAITFGIGKWIGVSIAG